MSDETLVRVENGSKGWLAGPRRIQVLRSVCIEIRRGESVAVMGPSGCGKSTLLHVMGCLTPLDEGRLWYDGGEVSGSRSGWDIRLRQSIGFVFQDAKLIGDLSVLENVSVPLKHRGLWGRGARTAACEALDKVGLRGRERHVPGQLSGGERIRAAIARAIVFRPTMLLCDEPTGSLDSATGGDVADLLLSMVTPRSALVMVTHSVELARRAGRVMHMQDGQVRQEGGASHV